MSIYTHYTIEATTRLGEVYIWDPLTSEYEYQNNQESSDISSEYDAINEFDYAVAVADSDEYIKVSLLRCHRAKQRLIRRISNQVQEFLGETMQNWKVRKKLYQESWELKDMRYRLQLLREFVDDQYYIDNATDYLEKALANIEQSLDSKQLKNAYEPLTKREKEN